jgi:hypothetical protein
MPEAAVESGEESALSRANPFPGLRPYEEEDANWFFGRAGEINHLLKRLRSLHFVAVVGASGSGKSSLVRAGVLPQVRDGYLDVTWQIAAFRPGDRPLANLAEALGGALAAPPNEQLDVLRSGPAGLVRAVRAAHVPAGSKLLILVDQFEELFQFAQRTGDAAQEEIKEFLKLLLTATNSDAVAVYVVITMRVEWMNECATYPGLAEAINDGIYLVPQMTRRQFQQAILGPLEAADGGITAGLLDRMLNDLDNKSDQLPVLQHALMRLWQRNVSSQTQGSPLEPLDIAGYEAVGTFANCLSAHAEEVFAALSEKQQRVAEILFRNITQVSRNRKLRRPRPVAEIMRATRGSFEELKAVIVAFSLPGRSFLVTTHGALTPESIVDISHEALIRQWTRLAEWVDDEAEIQARLRRLEEDADEWNLDRANESCLYTGARLLRAEELRPLLDPHSTTSDFLREAGRARFWGLVWRRGWIALTVVLVVIAALVLAAERNQRAKAAQAQTQLAEEQRNEAQKEAATASSQAKKAQEFQANLVQRIDAANGSATALAAIAKTIQAQRVYLQYVPSESTLAHSLQGQLQHHGFEVPGAEQVSPNTAPSGTQVRFFRPEDRADATHLATILRPLVPGGVSVQASANPNNLIPAGQFEVWLVPPPATVASSSETPTRSAAGNPAASPAVPSPAAPAAPPTLTASLSQDHVPQGGGVTLTWHTDNASDVQIEGIGSVQPSGSMVMTPAQSTSYKLIAKGNGGTVAKSLDVDVTAPTAASLPAKTTEGVAAGPAHSAMSEPAAVQAALARYKEAYQSESVDDMRRAWPTMSKSQQKNMSTVFNQFNAIRLELNCPEQDIHIDGASATASCRETATYSQKGKRLPEQSTSATFRLSKQSGGWVIDSVE